MAGFLLATGAASLAFDLTRSYDVFLRGGICVAAALAVLGVMRALTSWEHNWFSILACWAETRAPALLHPATLRHGGTSISPLPDGQLLARDIEELRDYAG